MKRIKLFMKGLYLARAYKASWRKALRVSWRAACRSST